ncbi:HD domain-containing protein [Salicibibacter kimchii]|uniref:HD domain-containing protein n=1 Tax=Salicibibacter kimchii TaxID=2099786 RepID=A0A345BXT2_9BACI|nr:HD domain-containing protein [Salicibibacter kimchii]AXF55763.1 HD domain-containing protein [Salicibibacter kimchii]
MQRVTLATIYSHPVAKKYVVRAGLDHAIKTALTAFDIALRENVDTDLATKAAFLHDIGHYQWYRDGEWDFYSYKENDIHAIKGAERAHKLLIRLGEGRKAAKEIALAILLHTDSYLPEGQLQLDPLQQVVARADEANEEAAGVHHYREIPEDTAIVQLQSLDQHVAATEVQRKTS